MPSKRNGQNKLSLKKMLVQPASTLDSQTEDATVLTQPRAQRHWQITPVSAPQQTHIF